MQVSVIVPVRDGAPHLPALFAALEAQTRPPLEVLVADDGSTDGGRELAERAPVVTRVVRSAGRGPGAARNAAAREARGDVLAFTDADCRPAPDWLERAAAAMERADLVQGAVEPDGPAGPWDRTIRVQSAHGLFETANLLIRCDLFERLGGFEPWLRPRRGKELGEDVWLGWRARRAGARVVFDPDALVRHAVIPRTPIEAVTERARLRFFPVMTARIPELRDELLFGRVFLSKRSAAFDAALAGALLARRRPAALALALPYARMLARDGGAKQAAVRAAADAVGCGALLLGSVRARSAVL